jgi:Mg-chelatase subunit ChlD
MTRAIPFRGAGSALLAALLLSTPASTGDDIRLGKLDRSVKDNLDLPCNAGGSRAAEEEEEVPDIIFFYGHVYEASAVVFTLDESGSMGEQGRWEIQKRQVTRAISELDHHVEYGVVYYGGAVTRFRDSPVPATATNKQAGMSFVVSREPQGLTCMGKGVVDALRIVRRSGNKHKAVIVTSDGGLNCETGRFASTTAAQMQRVLRETLAANPGRKVKVHTIFVGVQTNRQAIEFMRALAEAHGGTFRMVSG